VVVERWCFLVFSLISGVTDADPDGAADFEFEGLGALGGMRRLAGSSTWAASCVNTGDVLHLVDSCLQFLIPINSSMRPSYVSWVRSGVIMSMVRSRITSESKGAGDSDEGESCSAVGFVRRVASRCVYSAYLNTREYASTYGSIVSLS